MTAILDNIASVWLAAVLWFMVHQNGIAPEPFRRSISTGYATLLGLVLLIALSRNTGILITWLPLILVLAKLVLALTLTMVACRLVRLYG